MFQKVHYYKSSTNLLHIYLQNVSLIYKDHTITAIVEIRTVNNVLKNRLIRYIGWRMPNRQIMFELYIFRNEFLNNFCRSSKNQSMCSSNQLILYKTPNNSL